MLSGWEVFLEAAIKVVAVFALLLTATIFLVWIDALEKSLNENTTFILETNVAPFHLADQNARVSDSGIPLPEKVYDINQQNLNASQRAESKVDEANRELAEKGSNHE